MIKTINIKVAAGDPQAPLGPFYVIKNSAASLTIIDVPKALGSRMITGVTVRAKNADGTELGVAAVRVGSAWGATIPATHFTREGTISRGIVVQASGKADDGTTDTTWLIGAGQVVVLSDAGAIVAGDSREEVDWYNSVPTSPKKGAMCIRNGTVQIYTKNGWVQLGGTDSGAVHKSDFATVTPLGSTFTENEMKTKLNTIITILRGMSAAFLAALCIYSAFGGLEVMTATKGDVPNTASIVTNVTFTGSTDLTPATNYANAVSRAATNYTDAAVSSAVRSSAVAATNYTDAVATGIRSDTYTKDEADELFASQAEQATTRAIVQTWEGFLDGSNVVFSITNYISGSYNLSDAKLRILEMTNGVYREVYNSRGEIVMHIENFKANDFRVATNSVITAVNAAMSQKADKAWGKYTSSGGEAPSNTVYMTAPNTVFAGGLEYERVAVGEGAVCILTTKGAPVWTQGDEGMFKFQDDGGTNYFGFAKTDSYTIGAHTDGITVQNHIVTLTYNVTMSGVPCIWYKADISSATPWEQLNTSDGQPIAGASHSVSWDPSPAAGTEVCWINCQEAKGFFKATIEVPGEAKFMTNMAADLGGGIICTNSAAGRMGVIKPTYNGSTVTWTWSGL